MLLFSRTDTQKQPSEWDMKWIFSAVRNHPTLSPLGWAQILARSKCGQAFWLLWASIFMQYHLFTAQAGFWLNSPASVSQVQGLLVGTALFHSLPTFEVLARQGAGQYNFHLHFPNHLLLSCVYNIGEVSLSVVCVFMYMWYTRA